MRNTGTKTWFTAAELADLALPGLPSAKRKVNERAAEERWALASDDSGQPLARPRAGRGGGMEYSIRLLPATARAELVRRGVSIAARVIGRQDEGASQLWSWFDQQSDKTRVEAERRLRIIERIDCFEAGGMTRSDAVAAMADSGAASRSTLWAWLKLVEGVAPADRLPCLAPRRRGGGAKSEIDAEIWQFFKSDFLRLEEPSLSSCYLRAQELAASRGVDLPCERTLQRRLESEVDPRVIIARRKGAEALRRSMPAQERSVAQLHAMQAVNVDGHKFDVFVRTEDGRTIRPIMVAIQDVYSRKLLAWRIAESESAYVTRLAFADLFRTWGIPLECLLDNGRGFASKWITGGAKTRFRFKIKDDEPTGLLTSLNIKIHWATPYRGQSKPIERAFRELADYVARHPAMAGAYTGNKPDAKPENYNSKAVPIAEFRRQVAKGIAIHNARGKRQTEMARGRSFDDAFAESYASAPIGKASPEQLRLALLAAEQIRVDRRTGELRFMGNRYWSPEMSGYHGRIVTVRFDPENLHDPLHVYDQAGAYLLSADIIDKTGFFDVAGAKRRAKQEAELRRAVRTATQMEDLLDAEQLAAMLPDHEDDDAPIEASIVRPVRHRATAGALAREQRSHENFTADFSSAVEKLRLVK
ncbi:MAG: transposase domain-containing protein [Blastomonas sp.]